MIPFVIVADFEAITTKIESCEPNSSNSYRMPYQKHEAVSFCYYIIYAHGQYKPPVVYRGKDASKKFMECLCAEAEEIENIYNSTRPLEIMSESQKFEHASTKSCYICGGCFTKKNPKVYEHDHLTGKYRGAACNTCNLKFKLPKFIPVFLHNLSGYDAHFIVKELGFDEKKIGVIAENEEKYISFSKQVGKLQLRFLDSFRFMASSLESLASNLQRENFKITKTYFSSSEVELLFRKGVYPYDYMDSMSKFDETCLPPKEAFYSNLNESEISDDDYEHAEKVWREFNIQNMGEYTELYVKTDVLLLADVLQAFRSKCYETYGLDMAWYFTAPGLSWDAMLKHTQVQIELLTDYDMLMFVEKGIRGGVSQCSHRYAKANNEYMAEYTAEERKSYLLYLDENNLYGWSMSQSLPLRDFQWCDDFIDVTAISDDSETGYILEVDLDYPCELHDEHNAYPLAPVNKIPPGCKEKRLLLTLENKRNYIVHYRNLKLYLKHGLVLKKIHKVIQFHQEPFLKKYIEHNTTLRMAATNSFEKNFYKLMNNSVFGKCMEDVRRRRDIRLCCTDKQAEKLIAKPNFHERNIFSSTLAAVHMRKTEIFFKKPITIGMAVLDISKTLMYKFYYEYMQPTYKQNLNLLYTDTDSFIFHIFTEDIYNDMKKSLERFDTSDYAENNVYGMPRVNKKKLGLMKDECAGGIMTEFAGLRSKVYSYIQGGDTTKKLKGVKKQALKRRIHFDDYKNCIMNSQRKLTHMQTIQSTKHDIFTCKINKLALSPHDEKRYVREDNISTFAWGHCKI